MFVKMVFGYWCVKSLSAVFQTYRDYQGRKLVLTSESHSNW